MTVIGVVNMRIDAPFKNIPEVLGLRGPATDRFRKEHVQKS